MTSPARSAWEHLDDAAFGALARYEDPAWVGELYRRYRGRLLGCAHRMLRSVEVDDAVQEIATRIVASLPRFRGDAAIGTWIYSVARNTCLDIRRRRRSSVPLPDLESLVVAEEPDHAFEVSVVGCRIAHALGVLPPSQAQVVLLRLGMGLSTAETARYLGVTTDAVKARLRRGRAALRARLSRPEACPMCAPGQTALSPTGVR